MITALLYLDKGTGATAKGPQQMRGRRLYVKDIANADLGMIGGDRPGVGVQLFIIADHARHLWQGSVCRWINLRAASCDDNFGLRVFTGRAPNRLMALPFSFSGDGAGIDHHPLTRLALDQGVNNIPLIGI